MMKTSKKTKIRVRKWIWLLIKFQLVSVRRVFCHFTCQAGADDTFGTWGWWLPRGPSVHSWTVFGKHGPIRLVPFVWCHSTGPTRLIRLVPVAGCLGISFFVTVLSLGVWNSVSEWPKQFVFPFQISSDLAATNFWWLSSWNEFLFLKMARYYLANKYSTGDKQLDYSTVSINGACYSNRPLCGFKRWHWLLARCYSGSILPIGRISPKAFLNKWRFLNCVSQIDSHKRCDSQFAIKNAFNKHLNYLAFGRDPGWPANRLNWFLIEAIKLSILLIRKFPSLKFRLRSTV